MERRNPTMRPVPHWNRHVRFIDRQVADERVANFDHTAQTTVRPLSFPRNESMKLIREVTAFDSHPAAAYGRSLSANIGKRAWASQRHHLTTVTE